MLNSECLWLELCKSNSLEKFIVGTVYRYPDQSIVKNFLDGFSDCLNDLSTSSKPYYILGGFNINILQSKRTGISHDYINLIVAKRSSSKFRSMYRFLHSFFIVLLRHCKLRSSSLSLSHISLSLLKYKTIYTMRFDRFARELNGL